MKKCKDFKNIGELIDKANRKLLKINKNLIILKEKVLCQIPSALY